MVSDVLGPEGFALCQCAELPVKLQGRGFEQPCVQAIGGHPVLLARGSRSSAYDMPAPCEIQIGASRGEQHLHRLVATANLNELFGMGLPRSGSSIGN